MIKCTHCGKTSSPDLAVHSQGILCYPVPIVLCSVCWGKLVEQLVHFGLIEYDRLMYEVENMKKKEKNQ